MESAIWGTIPNKTVTREEKEKGWEDGAEEYLAGEPESLVKCIYTYVLTIPMLTASHANHRDRCNCRSFQGCYKELDEYRHLLFSSALTMGWCMMTTGSAWGLYPRRALESLHNSNPFCILNCVPVLFLLPETTRKVYYSVIMIISRRLSSYLNSRQKFRARQS